MKLFNYVIFACLIIFAPFVAAQTFKEGVDYEVLDFKPSKKKQVVEFFSYSCPGCYKFDPFIESFLALKPKDIQFKRVPVDFGRKAWKLSARAYILAKTLGVEERLSTKIFNRVQGTKGPFLNEADLKQFFLANGITQEKFNVALKSYSAKVLAKSHQNQIKKFGISSVPTVIVNGKYQTKLKKSQSKKEFKRLVEYLANKDR